jgi:hypothetical protein
VHTSITCTPGNGVLSFTWTRGVGTVSTTIRYGTAPNNYTSSVPVGNTVAWSISSLTNGTTYYYQIGAVNGIGTTWSAEGSATPHP